MKNHDLYKALKKATADYTVAQAQSLTDAEIRTLAKIRQATATFVKNMRITLINELQRGQNVTDREQVKSILDANMPNWKEIATGKDIDEKLSIKEVVSETEVVR